MKARFPWQWVWMDEEEMDEAQRLLLRDQGLELGARDACCGFCRGRIPWRAGALLLFSLDPHRRRLASLSTFAPRRPLQDRERQVRPRPSEAPLCAIPRAPSSRAPSFVVRCPRRMSHQYGRQSFDSAQRPLSNVD